MFIAIYWIKVNRSNQGSVDGGSGGFAYKIKEENGVFSLSDEENNKNGTLGHILLRKLYAIFYY